MSKIEVNHLDHISPGALDGLIAQLDYNTVGTIGKEAIVHLEKYRIILIKAYEASLHETDPEFWGGKPKTLRSNK